MTPANIERNAPLQGQHVSQLYATASKAATAKGISQHITLYGGRRALLRLNIVIVGCGLGGLAAAFTLSKAGHRVTILESAPALGEVGAGIQVTPNLSRLLIRWGLGPALERTAVEPDAIVFRRYSTGEKVGYTQWRTMRRDYGSPYYHIHRADFHRLLFDLVADTQDVTLRLNSTVNHLDPKGKDGRPNVRLSNGEVVHGDLIIGADGIKSMIREVVIGKPDSPTATGDAAYRALVPCSELEKDPDLRSFVELPEMTAWMAPGRHLMAYCIRRRQEFNMVLLHPDDGSVESWTAAGSADKMRKDFADFEPRVQKLLALVPSTLKWKLMDRAPLEKWIHPDGRVALLGDACHPMLPYRAQGAAMAIEDAAFIGNIFSRLSHPAQIAPMLNAYQDLRFPRAAATQLSSRLNQKIFHLNDGPEQEERDASMRSAMLDPDQGSFEGNQNQWADQRKNDEQFRYDADKEAERWWTESGEAEVGRLGSEEIWASSKSRL
ncbi:FAD/NAD(P)-binding domain-containing protein [Ramaria rubella]|nr:FAD/NAD(P)-binding domain-containing protein [Ramaria rubella]